MRGRKATWKGRGRPTEGVFSEGPLSLLLPSFLRTLRAFPRPAGSLSFDLPNLFIFIFCHCPPVLKNNRFCTGGKDVTRPLLVYKMRVMLAPTPYGCSEDSQDVQKVFAIVCGRLIARTPKSDRPSPNSGRVSYQLCDWANDYPLCPNSSSAKWEC